MPPTNATNPAAKPATGTPNAPGSPDIEAPDTELVQRAQAGDTAAFDELVTRYRGRIYAMTYNLIHNDADALDLSQDIFVKAWKALPRFEARAGFFTWLYRIAHNVCYDWLRSRRIESSGEFDDANEILHADPAARTAPTAVDLPDQEMSREEMKKEVMNAIAQLSPDHRTVILLKEIEDLSYKEIADITGATMGTVMSRLFYARKKLQAMLQGVYEQYIQN